LFIKEGTNVADVPIGDNFLPNTLKGSKKAPINIGDTTPKATLVFYLFPFPCL
jgi:hypothetical protein